MRPDTILENGNLAKFTYNSEGERVRMRIARNDTLSLDRFYVGGNYEVDVNNSGTTERLYLNGDAYSAPAVYIKDASTGSWNVYYICRDYLGSITAITNSSGSLVQELSYDAWGRLRDPVTQVAYIPGSEPALLIGRGYTGHEHLAIFGLINMNARLYDPALGRFLSPDSYVQSPDFSQSFNRYSYGLNNPLKYTDPSGCKLFDQQAANVDLSYYDFMCNVTSALGGGGSGGINYDPCGAHNNCYYGDNYGNYFDFNGNSISYNVVYQNYIFPKASYVFTGKSASTLFGYCLAGFDFSEVTFPSGATSYVVSLGSLGKITTDANGNIYSTNPTAGTTSISLWGDVGALPSEQGVDWKGVINATVGLIGGVAEMAVGGASEYFSVGTSTEISGPLMFDGGVRTVANAQRLFQYFNGNANLANAYPTSLGGLAGKGIDMALGTSVYKVGLGQSIGSMGNDLTSFVVTGGTGGALLDLMKTPSVSTGFNYFFTVGGYPYSLYYDKPDK